MYLEFFGLAEAPFRITPHTDFFFSGAKRGATLNALSYAILNDEGIVKVGGEVGSGKTMLCRVLMEQLPEHVVTVFLANPSLSRDEIIFAIAEELKIRLPENVRLSSVLRAVQEKLIKLYAAGRQVVVLIDEAHSMPTESLEEIRLLSNLESNRHKLLQLVLFGQPELDVTLAKPNMRQLKERITQHFMLEPLVRKDVAEYLNFRMNAAGYRGANVFSPTAVKAIARASQGLTRRINILADKSLLAAFSENTHQVDSKQVQAAVRDAKFSLPYWQKPVIWAGAGVTAAIVLGLSLMLVERGSSTDPNKQGLATSLAASEPGMSPPISAPHGAEPAGVRYDVPESLLNALGPLGRQRVAATRDWLAAVSDDHWFVQLLDAGSPDQVESFVAKAGKLLDPAQLHVYVADLAGDPRIGVIYGDYPTREAANQALTRMPEALSGWRPYPRQVKKLRRL